MRWLEAVTRMAEGLGSRLVMGLAFGESDKDPGSTMNSVISLISNVLCSLSLSLSPDP